MTDRERWTVYPLLFLALGISLKDKLTQSVSADRVQCETLVCSALEVADGGQRVGISRGTVQAKNLLCQSMVVLDESGKHQLAAVTSNADGGFVRTLGSQTGTYTVLGNFNQFAGLLFIDARGAAHAGPLFASPVPVPIDGGAGKGKPAAPGATEPGASQPNAAQPEATAPEAAPAEDAAAESEEANAPAAGSAPAESAAAPAENADAPADADDGKVDSDDDN